MATYPTGTVLEQLDTDSRPTAGPAITGEALAAMSDLGPCELVEGVIVPMSPTGYPHGDIEFNLGARLREHVAKHKLGKVMGGETGVYTRRSPDTVRGVDVLFVSYERYAQRQSRSYLDVAPELIVEILSPDDSWSEVTQKLREYFAIGVQLVWVVEPQTQSVFVFRSLTDVREFRATDLLTGDPILPEFVVGVADLFSD